MKQPLVTVIVAVYKVEEYIERCLHTLFGQTLENIEYIFIDDASPDSSMEILMNVLLQYPDRKDQVKIIRHEQNQGVAAARTSGILAATGEYMIHCDPDDFLELNMYEEMYNTAKRENTDLVFCDFVRHLDTKKLIFNLDIPSTPHKYLKLRGGIHHGAPLWNVLTRSSIIKTNNILPFKGGDFEEDYICLTRILYYSISLIHIHKPLYHYVSRPTSICNFTKINKRYEVNKINIDAFSDFFKDKKGFKNLRRYKQLIFKFSYKRVFLDNPEDWYNMYKDCHKAIFLVNNEKIKTRIIWAIFLVNPLFFKWGQNLYNKITGRNLLD